jgi:V/A-type H+-transporting ATPase subunit D
MTFENISPTRINLIQTKRTLTLAESGRDILERKREILLRELRRSIRDAEKSRNELTSEIAKAFKSLQEANIAEGSETVETASLSSSLRANFVLDYQSIMGVTVPIIKFLREADLKPDYGFANTNVSLDNAFELFYSLLDIITELARKEGATFQIANEVRRTQRRVNALDYVLIPKYRETAKRIELVLEEKEREEFVRMKKVKKMNKERASN